MRVARPQVAQPAAPGAAFGHHDHGVHALVFHFDPLGSVPHEGVMIGGGVEILGRAVVALHRAQQSVAGIDRGAAQLQQALQQALQRGGVGGFDLQTEIRGFAVGAADAELLHFEAAAILHDLIEDVLHDMGVDQVAFGFDHFLEWHRVTIVAAYAWAAGAKRSSAPSNSRIRTGLER